MAKDTSDNPLQGYFEWQVTTLLLAYDLSDPIPRDANELAEKRRRAVEDEVTELSLAQIPQQYKDDPNLDWPAEVMMALTRATFARANAILAGRPS